MKDKILITGATGFVGSWMTKYLLEQGHKVKVLKRTNSDVSELSGLDIEYCIGDVTDKNSILAAASDVQSIFHLAGFVGYTKTARSLMEKVNVQGTKNIVQVCTELKISRLLYFSSVTAIGAGLNNQQVLNEESEYNIDQLNLGYFQTKHAAEKIVMDACKKNEISAAIVNPSTIYGPGDAKKGSRKTQLKVARGEFPVYTSGGANIISIHDVTKAAYNAYLNSSNGERYILAGENITIKQLFEYIAECAGVEPPKIYLPNFVVFSLGQVGELLEKFGKKGPLNSETAWTSTLFHWFDSSKAQRELGLKPKPAKDAICESVNWVKDNIFNQLRSDG
ncbi:MAG: NAD-dependent epimerase/dehydratase family protein [Bdellovibrionaceae bacterium]|jgi:dihydroflavonol-4-reductase|nr:NAD-dependent epimerase/dehydratase family protein [Pseudobdellovibrionaceae bacterium]